MNKGIETDLPIMPPLSAPFSEFADTSRGGTRRKGTLDDPNGTKAAISNADAIDWVDYANGICIVMG